MLSDPSLAIYSIAVGLPMMLLGIPMTFWILAAADTTSSSFEAVDSDDEDRGEA